MSYNPSLISPSPGEDPKGGSFLEESSGGGDDSNVLGGDSLVTGPLGAVLLAMYLTGMVGNIYTVVVASGRVAGCSAGSLGVYMVNLALADLLYLSTIPFVVCTYFAHDWFFGDVGCRLLLSLDLLTMHASIFLLTAMSLERDAAEEKEKKRFLPFWAWQLAGLYQREGLGIGPTTQAYLNFGVTCLAYGNSCVNPFLYTLLSSSYRRRRGHTGMGTAQPAAPSQQAAGSHSIPLAFRELMASVRESEG
ncbi:PREDICTED: urotensin-2 receptor-like [Corvus brachyrhynchos]|uniref:urotensin-2 receptor-like n=1 Tax=Corvus brachyrhynchos TaxID=85066 RepID=UPI0004DDDF33|nr:PREDICTED: urotensin-2 receptor-like [Corvus brachyrhynchos]